MNMLNHFGWDAFYWLTFVMGQLLFALKRAYLAKRSPLNALPSIGAFFMLNWVPLLFRAAIEWGLFLYPYRHWKASALEDVLQRLGWNLPFQIGGNRGLVGCFFLGMGASMLLDWAAMQDSILGVRIPNIVKENIPQLAVVQDLVQTLGPK